jgi:hypothetical protein
MLWRKKRKETRNCVDRQRSISEGKDLFAALRAKRSLEPEVIVPQNSCAIAFANEAVWTRASSSRRNRIILTEN